MGSRFGVKERGQEDGSDVVITIACIIPSTIARVPVCKMRDANLEYGPLDL